MVISEGWAVRFGNSFCHGTKERLRPRFATKSADN